MRHILDVHSYDPPAIASGHQEYPHYTDEAPVGLPVEKDTVRLQVCIEEPHSGTVPRHTFIWQGRQVPRQCHVGSRFSVSTIGSRSHLSR